MTNGIFKKTALAVLCVSLLLTMVFTLASCKEEHVHAFDEQITEPTCTEAGAITRTCECGEVETETIPATGHDLETVTGYDPTCTEDGLRAYEVCENCDYSTLSDDNVIAATGHTCDSTVEENRVEPTCTAHGSYDVVEYCETCGEELTRYSQIIISDGHIFETIPAKVATCLPGNYEYEKCSVCGLAENYIEIPAAYEHIKSEHPVEVKGSRVDATCTEDGYYDEAICCTNDNCGIALSDTSVRVLPALGHDTYEVKAVDPTCTEVGHKDYVACSRCDYSTREDIAPLGHTDLPAVVENEVDPTCTENGSYDNVVYCSVCASEVSRETVSVNAPGHDLVAHEGKENSCTEDGWKPYDTCTKCDYTSYELVPAHGHKEGEYVIENLVLPTCTDAGSYDRAFYCIYCEIEMRREDWEVEPVAHNDLGRVDAKAPTCEEIGWEAYTCCSKCGYSEEYVEISATGHALTQYEAKAPACEEIGWNAYEACANCDYTTYEELSALDHSVVVLDAKDATCTEDGLTKGEYCSACDKVWAKQEVVPAFGHSYGADGVCSVCSHRISLGLAFELVNGSYVFTGIGDCGDTEIVIPAEVNGVAVTAIAADAFKNASGIETVVIPDSVKTIGEKAFFYCKDLKNVVIGNGVETIGDYAFYYCSKLETVTIGSGVKSIGLEAFNYCNKLSTVNYVGNANGWNAISISSGNGKLTGANKNYI